MSDFGVYRPRSVSPAIRLHRDDEGLEIEEVVNDPLAKAKEETPRPYRLYSAGELDRLPPAEWLIDQAIPKNAIVAVIGAKGTLKTFFVLSLSFHVATGMMWNGRKVKPGAVVYIYAEGPFGAKARLDALCEYHASESGLPFNRAELSMWFLPTRIPLNNSGAVASLIAEIQTLPVSPDLIVVDTLNQNLDGDEDGKGMGGFVSGCVTLRDALKATVLAVHHTPLGAEDRGRGHTSFDGAIDTRLIVSRDDDRLTVECTHQRNAVDGWSVAYEAVPVGKSLALKPSSPSGGTLKGQRRELLELVYQQGPLSYGAWLKASELKVSSFKKARKWLSDNHYVTLDGSKYSASDAGCVALGSRRLPEGHAI